MRVNAFLCAGHSKWAKIARSKGATDAARSVVYSRHVAIIGAAVRSGGADPSLNIRLADALVKARAADVPKQLLERALAAKSTTEAAEEISYEGIGPAATAVIVDALTDNRKRTAASVRAAFSKFGGEMQQSGAVRHLFETRGTLLVHFKEEDQDKLLDAAVAAGALDVEWDQDDTSGVDDVVKDPAGGVIARVICEAGVLQSVRQRMQAAGWPAISADVERVPLSFVEITGDEAIEDFAAFLARLDENPDVVKVWHNAAP